MKLTKNVFTMLLLAAMLLTSACSSGEDVGEVEGSSGVDSSSTSGATEDIGYKYYSGTDFDGEVFTVYNVQKDLWDMLCVIQPDEVTGETVNDEIYNRNEFVKSELNCEIEEKNAENINDMSNHLQTLILADADEYDAVYMPIMQVSSGLAEGYYHDLGAVSTVHLDEPYWDAVMLEATSLRNKTYFATSSAHLMGWDALWCLFFNESMLDDLQMEYPYRLVRDGEWTLAELERYCKQVADLNGDSSFAMDPNGSAIYGCTSFYEMVPKLIYAFDAEFVSKDENDEPVIACTSEKFINVCQRLAQYFAQDGLFLAASDSRDENYYQYYFEKQRTVFLGAEMKTAQLLRNMEQSFGIVPFPKFDETQEDYRSTTVAHCASFTIPITNRDPESVGLLFDALSFESDKRVIQPYFEVLVEQKGLRNEESIEMLNIIKEFRSFDLGVAYQLTRDIETAVRNMLLEGETDIMSAIDANLTVAEDNIATMLAAME